MARRAAPKIPNVADADKWPAAKVNSTLDRIDKLDLQLAQEFIDAGRGHERPSEYLRMDDPLARRARALFDARMKLRRVISDRYGPSAPSRLPSGRGFGPIRCTCG